MVEIECVNSQLRLPFTEMIKERLYTDAHSARVLEFKSDWERRMVEKLSRVFTDYRPWSSGTLTSCG